MPAQRPALHTVTNKPRHTRASLSPRPVDYGVSPRASYNVGTPPIVGVTDHGALTGLADDDHTQYFLVDCSRAFAGSPIPDGSGTRTLGDSTHQFSVLWARQVNFNSSVGLGQVSGGMLPLNAALYTTVTDALTNAVAIVGKYRHITSGDMADNFGTAEDHYIRDVAGVDNLIGRLSFIRAGADNTGKLSILIPAAGVLAERASLTSAGLLSAANFNASSLTASKLTGTDGSKSLTSISVGTSLDLAAGTLDAIQDIRTTAGPTFDHLHLTNGLETNGIIDTSLTAGRVVYTGVGGALSAIANLNFDDATYSLGVGVAHDDNYAILAHKTLSTVNGSPVGMGAVGIATYSGGDFTGTMYGGLITASYNPGANGLEASNATYGMLGTLSRLYINTTFTPVTVHRSFNFMAEFRTVAQAITATFETAICYGVQTQQGAGSTLNITTLVAYHLSSLSISPTTVWYAYNSNTSAKSYFAAQVQIPAGSAAALSLCSLASTTDGFYFPANAIGFVIGGTEQWRIISTALYPIADNAEDIGTSTLGIKALFMSDANSTAPSTAGEFRYNITPKEFQGYSGGVNGNFVRVIHKQTANQAGDTFSGATSETAFASGSKSIGSNFWAVGKLLRISASGYFRLGQAGGGGTQSWTVRIRIGGTSGTIIASIGRQRNLPTATDTWYSWRVNAEILCVAASGASNTLNYHSISSRSESTSTDITGSLAVIQDASNDTAVYHAYDTILDIDLDVSETIVITAEGVTPGTDSYCVMRLCTIEEL